MIKTKLNYLFRIRIQGFNKVRNSGQWQSKNELKIEKISFSSPFLIEFDVAVKLIASSAAAVKKLIADMKLYVSPL
jgi:hypothetical protein